MIAIIIPSRRSNYNLFASKTKIPRAFCRKLRRPERGENKLSILSLDFFGILVYNDKRNCGMELTAWIRKKP